MKTSFIKFRIFIVAFLLFLFFSSSSFAIDEGCPEFNWDDHFSGRESGGITTYSTQPEARDTCYADYGNHVCYFYAYDYWNIYMYPQEDNTWPTYLFCTRCQTATAILEAQCGSDNIVWTDPASCTGECDCSDAEDDAVAECGQGNYQMGEDCSYTCNPSCVDEQAAAAAECGEGNYTIDDQCVWQCKDPDADCAEQVKSEAEAACGDGTNGTGGYYVTTDPCGYQCKTCDDLATECNEGCSGGNAISSCSSDENGTVTGNDCVCPDDYIPTGDGTDPSAPDPNDPDPENPDDPYIPKTCSDAQAKCNSACSFVCNESNPSASSCDCSTGTDPDPDDTPDPNDPEDTNKWLDGIKGQLEEANGWLEKIADNSDTSLDLDKDRNDDLDNIAENMRRSVDNQADLQGSLEKGNALTEAQNKVFGEMNSKLGKVDDNLSEMKVDTSDIKTGLEGAKMTSNVDDVPALEGDEVTGLGYTTAANPSESTVMPSSESMDSYFGTVDTTETAPYIQDAVGRLSHIGVELVSQECFYTIPLQGLSDVHLNFCPYATYFSQIGSLLVMLVALYELLSLY